MPIDLPVKLKTKVTKSLVVVINFVVYVIKAKRPGPVSPTQKDAAKRANRRDIFRINRYNTNSHGHTHTLSDTVTNLLLCAGGAHGDNVRIAQRSEPRGFRRLEFQQFDGDDVDPTRQDHSLAAPEHGEFEFGSGLGLGLGLGLGFFS